MVATAEVIPRTVGSLLGPIGLAGVDSARKAYVGLDSGALREAIGGGSHYRQFLPVGARILFSDRQERSRTVRIYFTKPSLRELSNGERVPEYKLHDNPNGGWYWEEVSP